MSDLREGQCAVPTGECGWHRRAGHFVGRHPYHCHDRGMEDPYAPIAPGTEGEVDFVDDIGIEMELPLHAGQKIDETCTAIASDERVSFAVELCEQ